jgi:DNA-binding NarL/FixJ family response regulator
MQPNLRSAARPRGRPRKPPGQLAPREERLIGLIAQGLTNKQIAEEMALTEASVKEYCNRLYETMGLNGSWGNPRVRAARYWILRETAAVNTPL